MKIFILILFASPVIVKAQDIDTFACKVIQALKQTDSILIKELPIQPDDNKLILGEQLKRFGNETVDLSNNDKEKTDSSWLLFTKQLINGFIELRKKAEVFGVDWNTVNCSNYNFEIIKTSESDFPKANGTILLKEGIKQVKLVLKGMVKIQGKWRITFIDIQSM